MPHLSALSLALNRPGAVSAVLTPEQQVAALFASGEQGAWYDPSDYSTMFETAAGASPISTVEKPVGLIFDKRKGLGLGSELNDGLGDASNWTALGTNTIGESGDEITVTYVDNAGGATAALSSAAGLSSNLTVGNWYKITGEAKVNTGSVAIAVSAATTFETAAITSTSFVAFTLYFLASNATTNTLTFTGMGSGEAITVRSLSVKLLDGNHAYQTGSTARPVLRARYNLLTYSEQFNNALWVKSNATVTANSIAAPDATTTADTLVATGANATALYTLTLSAVAYTFSVYLRRKVGTGDVQITVDGTTYVTKTITIDWARYDTTLTPSAGSKTIGVRLVTSGDEVYIWGADLRVGTSAGDYQRIAAATDYATTSTITNVPFKPYLNFDGADGTGDFMTTATLDFTAGDIVFTCLGVRKTATQGWLVELSPNANLNNGAFNVGVGTSASGSADAYTAWSRGTSSSFADSATTYPLQRLNIVSSQADISASQNTLRIDGVVAANPTTSQGTGNYGTYAMTVGGRAAGPRFTGHMYGVVVRAAATSAGQITTVESYMAGKIGVTL